MKSTLTPLAAAAISCFASLSSAQSIDFQFGDDTINGDATIGASFKTALNGETIGTSFDLNSIVSGLTINVTPSQSDISITNSGIGIDSAATLSTLGDALTFSFNQAITLDFLDVGGFTGTGGSGQDSLQLLFSNQNPTIALVGGQFHNNSSDTITFSSGNALAANESFTIERVDGSFTIQAFTVTAVPEPNTYALLAGFCALGFVMVRRRSVK
tara:strand:- start:510 stop:1151 length:642 start_codon:yes stop_codon:yes gene_type:complete